MRKLCVLCLLLVSCKDFDEETITPKESVNVRVNTAVYEDTIFDEGQVQIVEIEDEAQFIGSDVMIRCTHCSPSFADSILQVAEKKLFQENIKVKKDSIH